MTIRTVAPFSEAPEVEPCSFSSGRPQLGLGVTTATPTCSRDPRERTLLNVVYVRSPFCCVPRLMDALHRPQDGSPRSPLGGGDGSAALVTFAACRSTPPNSASRPAATPRSSTSHTAFRPPSPRPASGGPGDSLRPRLDRGDHDHGVRAGRDPRPSGPPRPTDPGRGDYEHNRLNHDTNSHAHQRASIIGPSEVVPVQDGRLALGTWQQLVLIDFDDHPRERTVLVQVTS